MADFFRRISSFFGPTPTNDVAYGKYYGEFDRRDEGRFDDPYADSRHAGRHHYELREEAPYEAASVNSREEDYRYGKLHSVAETKEPEQIFIRPESGFQDRYSKVPDIDSHFRDDNIVTFDLSGLDPSEAKRYVDFIVGLVFGLRGRIKANGSVFTLHPHDCDINESQFNRMSS